MSFVWENANEPLDTIKSRMSEGFDSTIKSLVQEHRSIGFILTEGSEEGVNENPMDHER